MIGALGATPTICLQQHDCVATLIGKASSESEGARWGGVVPRIVLVVGVGVCVRITDGILMNFQVSVANAPKDSTMNDS